MGLGAEAGVRQRCRTGLIFESMLGAAGGCGWKKGAAADGFGGKEMSCSGEGMGTKREGITTQELGREAV